MAILKSKSGIHIKPENKGKFTATKKKTGKSTEELTHSSNPVTKKRAVFAQNAAKWKHANGGVISADQAAQILKDGEVRGKPITDKQRKYFGAMSNQKKKKGLLKKKQDGGNIQRQSVAT